MRNGFALVCTIKQAQSQKQAEIKRKNYMEKKYMDNQMNLKPCPFCGEQVEIEYSEHTKHFFAYHDLKKSECIIKLAILLRNAHTKEQAIEVWNRRIEK